MGVATVIKTAKGANLIWLMDGRRGGMGWIGRGIGVVFQIISGGGNGAKNGSLRYTLRSRVVLSFDTGS